MRQQAGIRVANARTVVRAFPIRLEAWLRVLSGRRRYRFLDEAQLRSIPRSDTLFIFGSGYSINDLTPEECRHFETHDTLSFNWFVHQQIVRVDYHMVREVARDDRDRALWQEELRRYFDLIRESPRYATTTFLVQTGFRAINGNRALGLGLLPRDRPVFLWRSVPGRERLGHSFADGLSHPHATLEECVNFGTLLDWEHIVLVGVDLYDRRYFWLDVDETRDTDAARGKTAADPHSRGSTGMIETLGRWSEELRAEGRALWVYNPRSLLAEVLPVFPRPTSSS